MKAWDNNATKLRLFIYGDPGAGKTTFLGTSTLDERCAPVLWLDAGGNPESIRRNEKLPSILTLESVKDFNIVYDWIMKGQPKHPFAEELANLGLLPSEPFKMLVIDGFTEIQRILMNEILGAHKRPPGASLGQMEIQQWGEVLRRMIHIVSLFYKLPLHVAITALESVHYESMSGRPVFGPMFQGQSRSEVPSFALAFGRLIRATKVSKDSRPKDVYNVLFFDEVGKFKAKEQYGSIPASMPNPTMSQLLDVIADEDSA
jgi:hypothetical protein